MRTQWTKYVFPLQGDIGYCQPDGHFYITDRLKELVKVKGLQVRCATEMIYKYLLLCCI